MPDTDDPLAELVTATEAAIRLGIGVSAISNWATRGYMGEDGTRHHLEKAGLNERHRPMYRFRDVILAERATRDRAGRQFAQAA